MKCPRCVVKEWPGYNEMCGEVGKRQCPVCDVVEGTEEFAEEVNVLLEDATEEDVDAVVGG